MTSAGAASGSATDSPLLERERELHRFDRLLAEVASGRPGLVVVEGSAGIGKSRLIAELRDRARGEGLRVVAARGSDLEREFPFGVVRQLFEPLLAEPAEREPLLSEAAAPARLVFEEVKPGGAGGDDVSFAVLHGLYWLTVNLAASDRSC